MSRRDQITMSPAEVEDFLAEHRTLVVASLGPTGHPHVVPMWFALLDGEIVFWTYASSQKVLNLRRDPRLSCLVEAGDSYEKLRGVSMEGTAQVETDPAAVLRVGTAILTRYGGGPVDEAAQEHIARQAVKRVAITFHRSRIASWDHRKLAAGVY
ncbi:MULTISPECIES: pyridoxamine 5'-phosphate oxidase family protein [unclassified Crossiella]|uniref:pyridoxamine 5'-phosphate oxidase family protein n=1 Tax=unclassified Crossiella TaxID=2620835 RepID=UPI001FFEAFC8|nr:MULTISPECIES: TIGR03618 family F420-dependent PPOX class oxidoreductase [unclassified Crossiella]MCK2241972.1 TIGR03618 family F420-dependent PPOX class oxidoreductase [Crossiella sp. S99.2]MCK2255875.1 TIGR03618 family F420-dependent PPOX class oxidoreductase [Crossiella sp. S99.1]